MVGVVVVSHSKHLADAVCELINQSAQGASVRCVGGTGNQGEELGTDAMAIMEAIQEVYSDDGVIVLMDMGSAVLSAETALEFLGEDITQNVKLCSAPIVEGAIVSAVQSSINANLEQVYQEALKALYPKQSQIDSESEHALDAKQTTKKKNYAGNLISELEIPNNSITKEFIITNKNGLHARPAAKFVQILGKFDIEAYIAKADKLTHLVSAKSINQIAMLNIKEGEKIHVVVWGNDAEKSLNALEIEVLSEFGEKNLVEMGSLEVHDSTGVEEHISVTSSQLVQISRGIAIGKALVIKDKDPSFHHKNTEDIESELDYFEALHRRTQEFLVSKIKEFNEKDNSFKVKYEILNMHLEMIRDPFTKNKVIELIRLNSLSAEYAWWIHCKELSGEYALIDNAYLKERAIDLIDVGNYLLQISDRSHTFIETIENINVNTIIVMDELSPNDILSLPNTNPNIIAFVTKKGSKTSHAAIIAKSIKIPVLGAYDISRINNDAMLIVDVNNKLLIDNPSKEILDTYRTRLRKIGQLKNEISGNNQAMAKTKDGKEIVYLINIANQQDVRNMSNTSDDGVGLFRTEFLFLERNTPPSEEEQLKVYEELLQVNRTHAPTIRIFDIGGDKLVPYLEMEEELNPFLGVRGIRLGFKRLAILKSQIRALLKASRLGDIRIMLPMVVDEKEVQYFNSILLKEKETLITEGYTFKHNINLGIMIETPAAAYRTKYLTRCANFFSIGTNDLTQYILAVERGNEALEYLQDHCHPAVIHAIHHINSQANEDTHFDVSVCGEMASDIFAVPLLIGLGIEKLSMSPSMLPYIKYLVRQLSFSECRNIAEEALCLSSAEDIRGLVNSKVPVLNILQSVI